MDYRELKKDLDPEWKRLTKREFIDAASSVDGRTRVGGPVGQNRLTAKRALILLGAYAGTGRLG
jgi:hypothetical protein